MSTPELTFYHVPNRSLGYGRAGVDTVAALRAMGVTVYDQITGEPGIKEPSVNAGRSETVAWLSVPSHAKTWLVDQQSLVFTMWEATRLPESFRERLHEFDIVVVPSKHNVGLFGAYHPDVRFLPLGVDPKQWFYEPRSPFGVHFDFLCAGSGLRKGADVAAEAFRMAFPDGSWGDGPIPRLICKSPRGVEQVGGRIETISGRLPDDEERALYRSVHCYVGPSRGEGFGLQPLQAIAQGIPTILTDAHGHDSFAHLGWPVPAKIVKAAYFTYGDAGDWWEPDVDVVAQHMRDIYDNYEAAQDRARASATVVRREFTAESTARGLLEVCGDRLGPYRGRDEWTVGSPKHYPVVTIRDHSCNIGGYDYYFVAGKQYYETADVKRVLFDSGYLHPGCLEVLSTEDGAWVDSGLTIEQWRIVESGKHEFCPTCRQRIGSGVTQADEEMAKIEAEVAAR